MSPDLLSRRGKEIDTGPRRMYFPRAGFFAG